MPHCISLLILPALICASEDTLKVALLQMLPDGNNVAANLAKAEQFCREAAANGADIALMPEMWSIGYTRFAPEKPNAREEFYALALAEDSPEIQRFGTLARELNMTIGVTYMQEYQPLPRNAITLFDRHGKVAYTYAKVHTSDFKPMEASMTPGEEFFTATIDTRCGPVVVGSMICFDREQPESARILMLKGAELILTPNACGLDDLRLQQFRIRAWENVVGVAMTNYPAPVNNGCSAAYDMRGRELAMGASEEGIFYASFDLQRLREQRSKTIWGNAYRRPHRYGILTNPTKDPVWNRIDGNGKPYNASER